MLEYGRDDDANTESKVRQSKSDTSLSADEPIKSKTQDELSRGHLVEVIARHIVHYEDKNCLVISMNAPWGAGKSSFLNLLNERLQAKDSTTGTAGLKTTWFNPWNFGNVDQLIRMFFDQLASAIGQKKKRQKKIGELFNTIGSLVTTAKPIDPFLSTMTGSVMKSVGGRLQNEKSFHQLKSEIDVLLSKHRQRLIVFIDDIDRLEPDVTRLLFRMIRLTANFPNLMYILSFDRTIVEKRLDEASGISGREYLEKIVQVSFDIPSPESEKVLQVLQSEIDRVTRSMQTREFDNDRWTRLLESGFKDHFRTLRQVKRFANGLRLTFSPIAREVIQLTSSELKFSVVFTPKYMNDFFTAESYWCPN